jgi:hypothetical protein
MIIALGRLAEGVMVLFMIIALKYLFAKLVSTCYKMEHLINSFPRSLYYQDKYLKDNMNTEAVKVDEIKDVVWQKLIPYQSALTKTYYIRMNVFTYISDIC